MAALDVLQDVLDLSAESALSAAIGAAIAALAAAARWLVVKRLPARRLWRFSDARDLIMIVASSALVHTGKYERPTTGIGQVRAMLILVPMLTRAYRISICNKFGSLLRFPAVTWRKTCWCSAGRKPMKSASSLCGYWGRRCR